MRTLSARLPTWLYNYIYNVVRADNEGDWFKAQQNLNNTHEENITYLGTYFPRTFTEVCRIVASLNTSTQYFEYVSGKNCIKVLSVGCGTGGDVSGLIYAMHILNPNAVFEVNLFDGNEDALNICLDVLNLLAKKENIKITYNQIIMAQLQENRDFSALAERFSNLDIVITSKFLNEVLDYIPNAYYSFVEGFSKILAEDGIIIINEVICRAYCGYFVPSYMNSDLNAAVRDTALSSVLPKPCRANRNCRDNHCYSRFKNGNYNDYTFRIISNEAFADQIIPMVKPADYLIDYKKSVFCRVIA